MCNAINALVIIEGSVKEESGNSTICLLVLEHPLRGSEGTVQVFFIVQEEACAEESFSSVAVGVNVCMATRVADESSARVLVAERCIAEVDGHLFNCGLFGDIIEVK